MGLAENTFTYTNIFFEGDNNKIISKAFAKDMCGCLSNFKGPNKQEIVIICVGVPKGIDSLGLQVGSIMKEKFCNSEGRYFQGNKSPIIEYKLDMGTEQQVYICGTLEKPVNGYVGIKHINKYITQHHPKAIVISIDASLGEKCSKYNDSFTYLVTRRELGINYLGDIVLFCGNTIPGSGVMMKEPLLTDCGIIGIVGERLKKWELSLMPFYQTRGIKKLLDARIPSYIINMAEYIANSMEYSLKNINKDKKKKYDREVRCSII